MADVYTRIGYIKGATGAQGERGLQGDPGQAATIEVGSVTTVPYGQTANVQNSGTSSAAVFDFTIPQGRPGEQTTDMENLTLGSITTSAASFPVPAVGETGKVLWGKVVKWFSDMYALATATDQRISVSGVTGLQVRGSASTNNVGLRVYKNAEGTAWTQETISADNATLTVTKREAGESTDTNVATIYSAGGTFKNISYSYAYTITANGALTITGDDFGVSTPSGYSVAGALSWFTGSQYVFVYRITPQNQGANAIMSLHNASNGSISATATITILYAKTIMIA